MLKERIEMRRGLPKTTPNIRSVTAVVTLMVLLADGVASVRANSAQISSFGHKKAVGALALWSASRIGTEAFIRPTAQAKAIIAQVNSVAPIISTTSLHALNRRNKFNKQNDLAAKMAEAKRQRESAAGGDGADAAGEKKSNPAEDQIAADKEMKLRNDRRRFADMLDTSIGGDFDMGFYNTVEQENEEADAAAQGVFRGAARLYEGDPAPSAPFERLLSIGNGEPLGPGGTKQLVPWERASASADYLCVIADPRPKSTELRAGVSRLAAALDAAALRQCVVINADTPAENRRFLKRKFVEGGPKVNILVDEDRSWMREYSALGEKRFSMTVFVLRDGRVAKLAREVEAEMLPIVVKNAITSL